MVDDVVEAVRYPVPPIARCGGLTPMSRTNFSITPQFWQLGQELFQVFSFRTLVQVSRPNGHQGRLAFADLMQQVLRVQAGPRRAKRFFDDCSRASSATISVHPNTRRLPRNSTETLLALNCRHEK